MYKNKLLFGIFLLALLTPVISAEIQYNDNETILYLIGDDVDDTILMRHDTDKYKNVHTVECINTTCVKGYFKIVIFEFDFDYEFIYDKDDNYGTADVNIKREKIADGWLTDTYKNTLTIDGVVISTFEQNINYINLQYSNVFFSFNNVDGEIMYGKSDNTYPNRLFFTTLYMNDQYDYLNTSNNRREKVLCCFNTDNEYSDMMALSGLTGIFYNVLDNIPFVGKGLQKIVFLPLFLIQSLINFSFTIIIIITKDWWYALMVLEIMCIFPVLRYTRYSDLMRGYIHNHVVIILFIKTKVVEPLIDIILRLIVIIRNMFRI
jgi:hypothetical protein